MMTTAYRAPGGVYPTGIYLDGLTFEQHASRARDLVRAVGLADCIHYAPNWRGRVDDLYDRVTALGLPYSPMSTGLLTDGRMVVVNESVGVFEPAPNLAEQIAAYAVIP